MILFNRPCFYMALATVDCVIFSFTAVGIEKKKKKDKGVVFISDGALELDSTITIFFLSIQHLRFISSGIKFQVQMTLV